MAPQIIYLTLCAMTFGVVLAKHGEPKGNYSVGAWLFDFAIFTALLWFGGFFTPLFK